MKVKFQETQSGHTFMYRAGEEYDLPRTDALYWVRIGRAELVNANKGLVVQEVVKKAKRPVRRTAKA